MPFTPTENTSDDGIKSLPDYVSGSLVRGKEKERGVFDGRERFVFGLVLYEDDGYRSVV